MPILLTPPPSPSPTTDSITSWVRLEPRCKDEGMAGPLSARIYDPLWLLARQWQVGEFKGEDAATPIVARWRAQSAPLSRYFPGRVAPTAGKPVTRVAAARYEPLLMPLEALVERRPVRATSAGDNIGLIRLAVEDGLRFLRVLETQGASRDYRDAFIREFRLRAASAEQREAANPEALAYWDLMAGRVVDGRLLAAAARGADGVRRDMPASLGIQPGDKAEIERAVDQWLAVRDAFFSEPDPSSDAWIPDRMEYAFSVAGALDEGEMALSADEYFEGQLDWHAVDIDPAVDLGSQLDPRAASEVQTVIPTPVTFPGAPVPRFWEFEDARLDYALLKVGDLVPAMLSEIATEYGNDWFVIPVDVNVGTLTRTRSLVVIDTFGVKTLIRPTNDAGAPRTGWSMFELSSRSRDVAPIANLFFLAPTLTNALEGRVLEEVHFLRDEMVNMAWALERSLAGPLEHAMEPLSSSEQMTPAPTSEATLRYRLSSTVPSNWIPLVPSKAAVAAPLMLVPAALLETEPLVIRQGRSQLFGSLKKLFDEEVPREGVRVTRRYQYARWMGGSTLLWGGFKKETGRGEGSSGLSFDDAI